MNELREEIEGIASALGQSQDPENVATSENNNSETRETVEVITAPNSYKQEFKDSFSTLSPEWQKYLVGREKEYEQGLSRTRNTYSYVDKLFNDRKDNLTAQGYKGAQDYLETLVGIADSLDKDPAATIARLQSIYGVANENNTLQRQLLEQSQAINQLQGYLQSKENERVKGEYDAFVNAKDEAGNPKHAYFEDVKGQMEVLLKAGLASNFEDAYNKAIWQVEDVRNKIVAEQTKAALAEKSNAAGKAKTAAFNPGSKNEPSEKELTLREELERNYQKLLGD